MPPRARGQPALRVWRRHGPCRNVWPPAISATVSSSFIAMRAKVSRMSLGRPRADRAFRPGLPGSRRSGPSGPRPADSPGPVHRNNGCLPGHCRGQPLAFGAPVDVLSSRLPDVRAAAAEAKGLTAHGFDGAVAGRTIRSAQEILLPYFCLIGQSRRRALSRLALSGQLLSGAKRCCPAPRRRRGRPHCDRCPRCARPCG